MNGIERCTICNYYEAQESVSSLLGANPVCFECIEHRAERWIDVHNAAQEAYALPVSDPRRIATLQYLRGVHYWLGPDEGYLDKVAFEIRVSRQMPVIRTEEEVIAERMARRIAEIREQIEEEERRQESQKKRRLWSFFFSWVPSFRNALSAGV